MHSASRAANRRRDRPRRHAAHELRSRWWWLPPLALVLASCTLFALALSIFISGTDDVHHGMILLMIALFGPVGVLLLWANCMRTSRKKRQELSFYGDALLGEMLSGANVRDHVTETAAQAVSPPPSPSPSPQPGLQWQTPRRAAPPRPVLSLVVFVMNAA